MTVRSCSFLFIHLAQKSRVGFRGCGISDLSIYIFFSFVLWGRAGYRDQPRSKLPRSACACAAGGGRGAGPGVCAQLILPCTALHMSLGPPGTLAFQGISPFSQPGPISHLPGPVSFWECPGVMGGRESRECGGLAELPTPPCLTPPFLSFPTCSWGCCPPLHPPERTACGAGTS